MSEQNDYNEQVVLRWAEERMRALGTWPDVDAALVRAEAADAKCSESLWEQARLSGGWQAAESALAEATALLETSRKDRDHWHNNARTAETWVRGAELDLETAESLLRRCLGFAIPPDVRADINALLDGAPRTPAPEAAWDIRGPEPVLVSAPAAESEPDHIQFPEPEVRRVKFGSEALAEAEQGWHLERERAQDLEQQNGVLIHDNDALRAAIDAAADSLSMLNPEVTTALSLLRKARDAG